MNRKRLALIFGVFALTAFALPLAAAPGTTPWFDLDNCDMCKNMTAEEGLMEAMDWENHLTKDGMVSITVVAPGHEEAFARSMQNMKAAGEKMMTGEKMYLCGFCQSYGGLHMSGASFEHIETKNGTIELVTSHDPAVVKMIHTHGQRTIDEYKKMVAAESHGDHTHGDHPEGDHPHGDH
ncbi:MAG: hypothetical protein ABFS42_14075 [Candidatus Krumholzibacteriota bacterium]